VVSVAPAVTPEQVRAVIDTVPDPEMPQVSVGDLGMVYAVRVLADDGAAAGAPPSGRAGPAGVRVEVELLPTFSGCPATGVIGADVARAVGELDGVAAVDVRFTFAEPWTPARITEQGRARLRTAAIAPPGRAGGAPPGRELLALRAPPCPICGGDDTVTDSPFGPTPCRSTHYCRACRNPFEAIKP
jgi:ring-1,2-phenylacetyl-CoA epoxidase subunit PaaD